MSQEPWLEPAQVRLAAPPSIQPAMSSLSLPALFSVKDKVALITGGGTGIGFCIAQGLVENGAKDNRLATPPLAHR